MTIAQFMKFKKFSGPDPEGHRGNRPCWQEEDRIQQVHASVRDREGSQQAHDFRGLR